MNRLKNNLASFAMVGSAIFSIASVLPTTGFAATLAGYKFNDVNKDQQCNMLGSIPAEPVFADETITIRNDETFESSEIQTDENGFFRLKGLVISAYC
jgi:hypothetical protein